MASLAKGVARDAELPARRHSHRHCRIDPELGVPCAPPAGLVLPSLVREPRSRFAYSGFLVSAGGLSAALSIHDLTSGDVIGSISSQARHLQTPDCFPPGWSTGTIGFPHFGQGLRNASAKIVLPPRERRLVRCDLSISIAPIIWVTVRLKRRRVFSIPDHRIRRGFRRSDAKIVAAIKLLISPR